MTALVVGTVCLAWVVLNVLRGGKKGPRAREVATGGHARVGMGNGSAGDLSGRQSEACDRDRCFCCGTGHYCEPDRYPEALGDTWTCPECDRQYHAFDPHASSHLPPYVLRSMPADTLGWRSTSPKETP